jgi:hypothetical protein
MKSGTEKFLPWSVGGWRLFVSAPPEVAAHLAKTYAPGGARAFDVELMGEIYQKLFEVVSVAAEDLPAACESATALGGNLDGCRIGFDLFLRLREEWGVPFEVSNDGDITALTGAMSLGVTGLLGIAMGSSDFG